jgi:hypothetical protein
MKAKKKIPTNKVFFAAVTSQNTPKDWGKGNWLAETPKHGKIIETAGGGCQR